MNAPLIEARGLNTYYGPSHILRDVDFVLRSGETLGLMGRNGMGKSTLLKTLMGLVKPQSGHIAFKGQDITGWPTYQVPLLPALTMALGSFRKRG